MKTQQETRLGSVNAARIVAMKDIRSEIMGVEDPKHPKHHRYKRKGFSPFHDGEFDLSDAPYCYNTALGFTF